MAGISGFEDIGSEELFALVWRDDLTGLYNRRFFARYMKQVADWAPGSPPVALAMMDMDNLKRINDRLGHMQGDASLKRIGEIMLEHTGEAYYAVRYAGDEFCLVFPNTGRDRAMEVANLLREAVAKDSYEEAKLPAGIRPSLSIGVAVFPEDAPAGGDDLTEKADEALYHSKRTGKNKVTSAADLKKDQETVSEVQAVAGFPAKTLVGREEAFKTVEEAVSLAQGKKNAFLLIEGEGGVGKTRMLSEVAKYAKERGMSVLIERCSAATREEPHKTMGALLDAYVRSNASLLAEITSSLEVPQRIALSGIMQVFKETLPRRRPRRPGGKSPPGRRSGPSGRSPRKNGEGRPSSESGRREPPSGARRPTRRRPPLSESGQQRVSPPTGKMQRVSPPTGKMQRTPPVGKSQRPPQAGNMQRPTGTPPPQSRPAQRRVMARPRPLPELNPAELKAALFSGLIDLLHVLCRKQGVVILLDDIDSADEATLEVIHRSLPLPGGLLFVGAARTDKGAPAEGDGEPSPYAAFRRRLEEPANALILDLQPFDQEETIELATHLLEGSPPPPELSEVLFKHSQGNPLFIEGVLKHLINVDHLDHGEDGWKVKGELPDELPLTLENLIRQQLKVLDSNLAALLARDAVVGPNFEFNVLQASLEDTVEEQVLDLTEAGQERQPGDMAAEPGRSDIDLASQQAQQVAQEGVAPPAGEAVQTPALVPGKEARPAYRFGKAADREKQDRFLKRVREKQDLIFDRDAIETLLLSSHKGKLPEVTEAPPPELFAALPILAKHIATAAKVIRVYPGSATVVREALKALVKTLEKIHQLCQVFTLSHRGNDFVVNGATVDRAYSSGQFQEAVVRIFRVNSIKSLTFAAPPSARELQAFLAEAAKNTVQVAVEKYFWAVLSKQHDLKSLGITQKGSVLKRRGETGSWSRMVMTRNRLAERNLQLVKRLIQHFMASVEGIRKRPPEPEVTGEALACLNRTLRRAFEKVSAVALHEGDGNSLVINGTSIDVKSLGAPGARLLRLLRVSRLRGLVVLKDVSQKELEGFMARIAMIHPRDFEDDKPDPVAAITEDSSFPNILIGDALFQLAHDLVRRAHAIETMEQQGDLAEQPGSKPGRTALDEFLDELLPLPEREADLPADFEWPSDALAKRARTLFNLKPVELVGSQGMTEFLEVVEALLLEDRGEVAQRLIHRMAINFSSPDTADRKRAAELCLMLGTRGTQELRARFFTQTTVRLADALELETDFEVFEKLAECAKLGVLDRIADGDWDMAARLVWSLSRRREARVEAQARLKKVSQRILRDVLTDPRTKRLFETIETGSQQERRRAARILEGMGTAAVDSLVRALMNTQRARVETFLIDMLAALVPESDQAIQKEVTPNSPPDSTQRMLRAAAVVCQDPTPVLVSGLQNLDQLVQSEAVSVARSIGHNVAQNVLRWALAHGTAAVQLEAVKHLGELSRPDTVDSLLDLLQSTNLVEVRREVCLSLGKLALSRGHYDKVVPVLTNFLRAGGLLRAEYHQDVRAAAAWALGQMTSNNDARKALERALDDKDKRVRLTARLTLEGRSI